MQSSTALSLHPGYLGTCNRSISSPNCSARFPSQAPPAPQNQQHPWQKIHIIHGLIVVNEQAMLLNTKILPFMSAYWGDLPFAFAFVLTPWELRGYSKLLNHVFFFSFFFLHCQGPSPTNPETPFLQANGRGVLMNLWNSSVKVAFWWLVWNLTVLFLLQPNG